MPKNVILKISIAILFITIHIQLTYADDDHIFLVVDTHGTPVSNTVLIIPGIIFSKKSQHRYQMAMDQINEQFSPNLLIVKQGTQVSFPNSDKTRHHVYSFSAAKTFDLPLYKDVEAKPILFDQEGIVHLGCNIHDKMSGTIIVTNKDVFASSNQQGEVILSDTQGQWPDNILVWHKSMSSETLTPVSVSYLDRQNIIVSLPITYKEEQDKPQKISLKDRLKQYKLNAQ